MFKRIHEILLHNKLITQNVIEENEELKNENFEFRQKLIAANLKICELELEIKRLKEIRYDKDLECYEV